VRIEAQKSHRNGGQQALGHVGHDDADEEDDGVEPVVVHGERDDEEGEAQEDGDAGDDVDEVGDFARDRRLARLQPRRQVRDAPHHRPVARRHHHALGAACLETVCATNRKSKWRLHLRPRSWKRRPDCAFPTRSRLCSRRLDFAARTRRSETSCQPEDRHVLLNYKQLNEETNFESLRLQDANVGRNSVAAFHFNDVTWNQVFCAQSSLLAVPICSGVLERKFDTTFGALASISRLSREEPCP